jgi:NAD(P)-dependent dehydrogenase (short-subunit alcohol dehydrogenase family)
MDTEDVTALVTGANRGLGRRFAAELVARGAKVYAAARRPETVDIPGVVPIRLDITDPESVRQAAEQAGDVNFLVNNAGISTRATLLDGPIEDIRAEMDTDPGVVAKLALDGVFAGEAEVLADDVTRNTKAQLSAPPR